MTPQEYQRLFNRADCAKIDGHHCDTWYWEGNRGILLLYWKDSDGEDRSLHLTEADLAAAIIDDDALVITQMTLTTTVVTGLSHSLRFYTIQPVAL